MEPQACLAQLGKMLADETRLLGLLAQQLQHEHELLVANDVDGLEQAASARQSSVAALANVDQDRRTLCRMLGHGADNAGLLALFRWCDPTGTLTSHHAAASRQAQMCREQNDRNGALVNARLLRLNNMLEKLHGTTTPGTYDARSMGRANVSAPTARMVSITA